MAIDQIKVKARDELIRLTEKELDQKFSTLSSKQQSIRTVKFYLKEIHNPVRFDISEEDMEDGIVDGKDDLGVDFIHKDDAHVLIIQTKYRSATASEDTASVTHFQSVLKRLRDPKLVSNKHLREILTDIDWDNDTFELAFVTFSKLEGQARDLTSQPPAYPADVSGLELRCDWKFLDETALNLELRGARNLARGASNKTITLYPIGEKGRRGASAVVEIDTGQYRSFIMALDARQLIRCYEELDRDSVFSLNIRNFIGNTSTNKNIVLSAKTDADNFFLYNNGVSCLASKVVISSERLEVTGLQVINGAQTIKALVNLARESQRKREDLWTKDYMPNALVRITEIPENYGKIREKITQYNNTQNTIKISDFRSNDEVQTQLKQQFGDLSRSGKKVAYLPKRTDRVPPNSEVIRLEEYAKSVYAFLHNPTEFSGSSSFLFSLEKNTGYVWVFGDGTKLWERMPEEEFKLRAGAYWLAQEFARHMKTDRAQETDPDAKAALERKWLLVYAASCVYQQKFGESKWKDKVIKLYKGDWQLGDGDKGKGVLQVYKAAKAGVITAYRNSKKNNKDFVHRNWMRGKDTPREIAEALETIVLPLMADAVDLT